MRLHLQRFVPSPVAQCFHSAPAAADQDASGPVPSLSKQLQGREPSLKEKAGAYRFSNRFLSPGAQANHVRSRALVRPGLKGDFNGPFTTYAAPELLHGLLRGATSEQGKEALRSAILEEFNREQFLDQFASAAAGLIVRHDVFEPSYAVDALASEFSLGRVIDLAFAEYIAARVDAALNKNVQAPAAIPGQAGKVVEVRVKEKIKSAKKEQAIKNNPLVSVLNLRGEIPDDQLFFLSSYMRNSDEIATLFHELIGLCTNAGDEIALKTVLAELFTQRDCCRAVSNFCRLAYRPDSAENKVCAVKAAEEVVRLPKLDLALDRFAQLRRGGAGPSDEVLAVVPGPVVLLLEARVRALTAQKKAAVEREETIQNHPIQQVLDIRDYVDNGAAWTRPLESCSPIPCAAQVAELVRALSQAEMMGTDKIHLQRAVGRILSSTTGELEKFADVACQKSRTVGESAEAVANYRPMADFLDVLYARQMAQYVDAHIVAAGAGTAPRQVQGVGERVHLLVRARADNQLKALKKAACLQANTDCSASQRAQNAGLIVDARESLSAQLRCSALSPERRAQLTLELDGHVEFESAQECDQVRSALGYAQQGKRNPDSAPGEKFLDGWPLSNHAAVALDQVTGYERTRRHVPVAQVRAQR
jgi:hypothetical protein